MKRFAFLWHSVLTTIGLGPSPPRRMRKQRLRDAERLGQQEDFKLQGQDSNPGSWPEALSAPALLLSLAGSLCSSRPGSSNIFITSPERNLSNPLVSPVPSLGPSPALGFVWFCFSLNVQAPKPPSSCPCCLHRPQATSFHPPSSSGGGSGRPGHRARCSPVPTPPVPPPPSQPGCF